MLPALAVTWRSLHAAWDAEGPNRKLGILPNSSLGVLLFVTQVLCWIQFTGTEGGNKKFAKGVR